MKSLFAFLVLGLALPAGACTDPAYKTIANAQAVLAVYDQYPQFKRCVDKIERAGVDLQDVRLWIKDRPVGNTGNVIKWFRIRGKDSTGLQTVIVIEQRLGSPGGGTRAGGFFCGPPSNRITRGC